MSTYPKRASLEGLEKKIFQLVSQAATPEQWAEWLRVPLEHAAAQGNVSLVDKLIEAGGNGGAGWKGVSGCTLLHAAAVGGNEGVVFSLIKAGAQPDVNVVLPAPNTLSPLYLAAERGHGAAARLFVMAGADVNFRNTEEGFTVLHAAILAGREELANELVMCGADVTARTSLEYSPLHLAAQEGLDGVVRALLLKGAEKDAVNSEGDTALMCACGSVSMGNPKLALVNTLLAAGVDVNARRPADGSSALHWASEKGLVPFLQSLLREGADLDARDSHGCSALHGAAGEDQAGAVDALTERGADIELKSNEGRTPLCSAAGEGKAKSLLALLRQGASVRAKDNYGETPMHLVCRFQPEGLEMVVDLLLRWGADETAADDDGDTPAGALVYEDRRCSQDEVDRVRLLVGRAPADRTWRRRGWLVMLRARASRARNESSGSSSGIIGVEGSNAAGGGVGEGRKMTRREGAAGVASGDQEQSSRGADGAAAGGRGDGNKALCGAVDGLVGMDTAVVFRRVLEFL